MFKTFGTTKEVFANQDEGLFAAFPITLDENVLTLETITEGGRTYVLEGSVVKEGSVVRGITAERYDITYGAKPGRVVLEGYAWASALTPNALAAVASLPKIVILPYKAVVVAVDSIDGLKAIIKIEGAKFATDIEIADITVSGATISALAVSGDQNYLEVLFSGASTAIKITAFDAGSFVGATGTTLKGLPISLAVVKGELHAVAVSAGANGAATVDKATAAEGEIVTITATPEATYVVDKVKVDGTEITAVSGAYKFVMPAHAVAVTVTFKAQG